MYIQFVILFSFLQIFVAIEGPVEEEKQSLIYSLSIYERRNFTNFVLMPRRNPGLLNSLEFERDLGKECFLYTIQTLS
jgi:hypothetical protein